MAENNSPLSIVIDADISKLQKAISDVKDYIGQISSAIKQTELGDFGKGLQEGLSQVNVRLDQLEKNLQKTTASVKEFGNSFEVPKNSIAGLKNRISELNAKKINLDASKSANEIELLTRRIENLQQLKNKIEGLGSSFNNIEKGSKNARTALTSLSLVAQDLPFGFIAIQNNLPNLIAAFGTLNVAGKGLAGSLLALKTALIGPAGLFLAFSVVTAAITYAIQTYGSFGNAINAIFGKITDLNKIQERANKSLNEYNKQLITNAEITGNASSKTSDQIFKIQTLSEAIKDTTLSETQRKNAIEQIQKLDPKTLENLSLQTKNYKDLDEFVKKYTDSLIANAVAQEYLSQVVATTTQITQQTNVLAEIGKGYADIAKKRRELNAEPIFDPATGADLTNTALGGLLIREQNLNEEFSKQTGIVNGLWKQLDNYKNSAKSATIEALKFFKSAEDSNGKVKDILKLDTQELDEAFNLKDIKSKLNEYGNILLDVNNTEKQRKDALNQLIAINPEFANTLSLNKSRLNENKTAIESNIRALNVLIQQREFDKRALEINNQFLKEQEKQRDKNIQAEEKEFDALVNLSMAYDKIGNSTDKIIVKSFEFTKALKKQQDITAAINKGLNNIYGLGTAEENDPVKRIDDLSKKIKQAKDNFESTIRNGLQEPFEDFFGTLIETGKFSLESFEGLFKNMLKNIAAQIVSAGIAKLISTILFPPGAAAGALAGAAAGNKSTGGVIGALISLFGGRRSAMNNVNFGGVGGGSLQMAGSVNLQLRGSDLVASINRTNSTINRIG